LSTKTYICGKEKSFLRLALFRSLKSMQTLIFLFFFGTIIILDTHCGYVIASKKLVFYYFLIYILTLIQNVWMGSPQLLFDWFVSFYQWYLVYYDICIQTRQKLLYIIIIWQLFILFPHE
jgi:hypothetical protein